MTVDSSGEAPWLERLHEFHRAAGVDAVVDPGAGREADWVIESEANEFWWPRGGSLKDILQTVPAKYGEIDAIVRHFLPVTGETCPEAMTYRLSPHALLDPAAPWGPERKRIKRRGSSPRSLRGWYPIEVLRFHVDDDALSLGAVDRALAEGVLTRDVRLRDALRTLAAGEELRFTPPTVLEDALFAVDVAVLGDADVVRARESLDALEERLAAVESTTPLRLERRLRSLIKGRLSRS
jgi:hypothetical protein